MTQKIQLKLIPEFKRVYGGGIIRWFDKTPLDLICPHFWELNWGYGCWFNCSYCYLRGTFRGREGAWRRPLDQVKEKLREFFLDHKGNPQILNSGELADSLAFPKRMAKIADEFEKQNEHKLLILTKSANVNLFLKKPRKQTVYSFSLNATDVARRWECKTALPDKRIDAAKKMSEAGYEVRVRIDPIFPIQDWRRHYEGIVYMLLSELPQDPDRITLGTPRGLGKTRMYSKDLSWWKLAFEENPSEDTGWGKKIAFNLRKEIYQFFYDKLQSLGFDKSRISMCKETRSMWQELKLDYTKCKCNCIW